MQKNNIFWFIIDSVRTYRSGEDDRDRIDIMDEFANDGVEFTNCFTSAPSSLLAAGAIYTSLPSVFIARHFNDWKFKGDKLSTVKSLVENNEYISFPLIDCREAREKYQFLLPPFKKKYLPKKYNLSDYAWRNSEVTEIFEYIMDNNKFDKPVAFTFWYDCRRDPKISEYVKRAIQKIKDKGMYEDAIIIMHSDHGYPDPRTNLNEGFFKNYGHDMVLTDDNIKTPFIIKYPGSPCNLKLPNVIGHVDILPTIFDVLKIPFKKTNTQFQGKSLLPVIEGIEKNNRIRRSDTRLSMDIGKITSLRSQKFKYLYCYDDDSEFLIDIINDKDEVNNLINSNLSSVVNAISEFRNLRKEYDNELFDFHFEDLSQNAKKSFQAIYRKDKSMKDGMLIVSKAPEKLLRMLYAFLKQNVKTNIDLIYLGASQEKEKIGFNHCYRLQELTINNVCNLNLKKYDVVLYLTENSKRVFLKKSIYKSIKSIKAQNFFMLNYNFEVFNYFFSRWFGINIIRLFFDWEVKGYFYKQEPLYFFRDIFFLTKSILKKVFSKKGLNEDLNASKEIMEFRKFHLKGNASGLKTMNSDQMNKEFGRIQTREE
ncbi:sulfatase/phosphatase domain-containing protein [Desulfobacula sp.]|uniref:sulfatase-like hydrolase/transferase n=1 Tax=Desulfobacula sp. TaxID=2593537 RepID=UPI0025BE8A0A|nr:sulfatase/phosphatase domain-containing protein [Desulfobacula sp.]MBC2704235.1 sulfatase-like hydrolase/transferase [Desulfobacula sp.]